MNKVAISEIVSDGSIVNNPSEAAQAFNKYFSEIGPNLANNVRNVEKQFLISENTNLFFLIFHMPCFPLFFQAGLY